MREDVPPRTSGDRAPGTRARLVVAVLVGVYAVVVMRASLAATGLHTDFDVVWQGARYLLAGQDPWALTGPGRAFPWASPLYYPGTALIAVAPLALLPLHAARAAFVGGSAALLAFAVTRDGWWRLLTFVSVPFLHAVISAQWLPLVAAAFLLAPLGVVTAAMPTTDSAPRRRDGNHPGRSTQAMGEHFDLGVDGRFAALRCWRRVGRLLLPAWHGDGAETGERGDAPHWFQSLAALALQRILRSLLLGFNS